MADLQAAFDELKSEVTDLEKQKTNLTQDIIGLRSKKTFLKAAVRKLEVARNLARTKYDSEINDLIEDLEAIELAIDERKIDLKLLLDKIELAKSELKTLQEKAEAETIELTKQLRAKKTEITEADKAKTKALEELSGITKQIVAERGKLDDIAAKVKQAQDDADSEIVQIEQSVIEAKTRLKKLYDKIDDKAKQYDDLTGAVAKEKIKLEDLVKKQSGFIEYEKRADKALKARESALLEGERNLAESKRRNRSSVLDNVA